MAVFSNLYFHQSFQNQSLRLAVILYLLQEQPWNSYPFVFKVPVNSILRVFRFLLRFVPNLIVYYRSFFFQRFVTYTLMPHWKDWYIDTKCLIFRRGFPVRTKGNSTHNCVSLPFEGSWPMAVVLLLKLSKLTKLNSKKNSVWNIHLFSSHRFLMLWRRVGRYGLKAKHVEVRVGLKIYNKVLVK